jgi:rhodanese-related sulfurtransferase
MKRIKSTLLALPLILFTLALPASSLWAADQAMNASALVDEAKAGIKTISAADAKVMQGKSDVLFVDVREANEFKSGHIPGSVNIPRGTLEMEIEKTAPDKAAAIVAYCRSGARSALATATLTKMGYTNVVNMDGGWNTWLKAGFPVE